MSTDPEERLRRILGTTPDASVRERMREHVAEAFVPPHARRRLPALIGRVLRPALAAAGVAAVGLVLALLIIASPGDPPTGSAGETGVETVLRPIPVAGGLTPRAAAERLAEVVEAQGAARGVDGVRVSVEGERVRVFMPGTHEIRWPRTLLFGVDAAIYDARSSRVASGPRLGPVLDAVAVPPDAAGPARHYTAFAQDRLDAAFEGPFATPGEARAAAAAAVGRVGAEPRVVSVPGDTSVTVAYAAAGQALSTSFTAWRHPLLGPGDIGAVRVEGDRLLVDVPPPARERVAARLAAAPPVDPGDLVIVYEAHPAQVFPAPRFERYDAAAGTLVFTAAPAAARALGRDLAGGGVGAEVAVESERTVGPPPARHGERVTPLPAHFQRLEESGTPFRPRPGSVLRAIETRWDGASWSLWSYLSADTGMEIVSVVNPGDAAGSGGCPRAPEAPVVFVCGSGSGHVGVPRSPREIHGRVGEEVASVTLHFDDGRTFPAAVGNGFFLLLVPQGERGRANIVARDAAGTILASAPASAVAR